MKDNRPYSKRQSYLREWYSKKVSTPEGRKDWCKQHQEYQQRIKLIALAHYGNKCTCCGETVSEFLTIDHTNNDGAEHRKKDPYARAHIHQWLRSNNFPEGFQVLCFNCNMSKHFGNGVCYHQRNRDVGEPIDPPTPPNALVNTEQPT